MKIKRFRQKLVSLLCLVLILVPMLVLGAYASSSADEGYPYSFSFYNGSDIQAISGVTTT